MLFYMYLCKNIDRIMAVQSLKPLYRIQKLKSSITSSSSVLDLEALEVGYGIKSY
jgi:hypothetical protein